MADQSSDFFKYGRGYALYSQGMTDVGRKFAKDPNTGEEIDASQPELIQAQIERDTLLLARAVGNDMTLTEYKNLHDSVDFLHRSYRDHKITNAVYQEKLWSLPDKIKRERSAAKQVHYKPSRDAKSGEPIAREPDHPEVFTQNMQMLSPGMFDNSDKIDFKGFWDSVVEKAGARDVEQRYGAPPVLSGVRPPGDGSVPQMAGAPPVQAGGFTPPAAQPRGSWLDQLQAGLDAAGIVEPTPFADGTNAAISAVRALADPKNAGTHLRNAGISLISAFVPYVGDTAKLAKYGGKLDGRTKGGRLLENLFGSPGGGGSGSVFGAAGGGSGGGPGGVAGGGASGSGGGGNGGILGEVTGGFANLAKAMGPVGFAVGGATIGFMKLVEWLGKVDSKSRAVIEDNRDLAQYSGDLSLSYMTLNAERTLRDIRRARDMEAPLGRLTKAQSFYEDTQQDALRGYRKTFIDLQAALATGAGGLVEVLSALDPIGQTLNGIYDWLEERESAKNRDESQKLRKEIEDEVKDLQARIAAKGGVGRMRGNVP